VRQLDRACSLTPPDQALAGARIARPPSSVPSWRRAMGRPRSVLRLGAAAFLLILGLGMFAELLRLRGRLAAINREQAALEARIEESDRALSRFREELAEERQQDLPIREKLKNITTRPDRLKPEKVPPSPSKEQVVSLALAPNMRAPGGIDKAVISADTRFVELKIAILAPGQQLIRAVAKTVDGKREIWTEEWPAARQPRSAGAVSMLIPADRFRAAEAQVYSLTLSRPSPEGRADQEFEIRYFRVISK
ncbi:MAG TPA: hypothetical protein VJ302_25935, partial [Blastocatellia bacterium]|nr:hypothetical protein [Blastocatellia bacterium]